MKKLNLRPFASVSPSSLAIQHPCICFLASPWSSRGERSSASRRRLTRETSSCRPRSKSSQVTIICIVLLTMQIVSKQLYISFTVFRREIVCQNSVILLWPDKISSLNLGCSRVRLCKGLIWFLWSCPDGRLGDRVFTGTNWSPGQEADRLAKPTVC